METKHIEIKPLDFVRPKGKYSDGLNITISSSGISSQIVEGDSYPDRYVGLVTEVSSDGSCSVEWLGEGNKYLHNAWWSQEELVIEDSLPNLLAREMVHPFGNNADQVDNYYPRK